VFRSSKPPPLSCSEIIAFALLAAVFAVGLFANWVDVWHALAAVGVFGAVLTIALAWQRTVEQAETARPLTRGEKIWNGAVFLFWLAGMGLAAWWYFADRQAK
jgi:hypothetical protein